LRRGSSYIDPGVDTICCTANTDIPERILRVLSAFIFGLKHEKPLYVAYFLGNITVVAAGLYFGKKKKFFFTQYIPDASPYLRPFFIGSLEPGWASGLWIICKGEKTANKLSVYIKKFICLRLYVWEHRC